METGTPRFNRAVNKLYNAWINKELNPFNCKACAVGNIVGHDDWKGCYPEYNVHGILTLVEKRLVHWSYGFFINSNNKIVSMDFTNEELTNVEYVFLQSFIGQKEYESLKQENQLNGLLSVVDYLAELDGIEVPKIKELFANKELPKLEPCTA